MASSEINNDKQIFYQQFKVTKMIGLKNSGGKRVNMTTSTIMHILKEAVGLHFISYTMTKKVCNYMNFIVGTD